MGLGASSTSSEEVWDQSLNENIENVDSYFKPNFAFYTPRISQAVQQLGAPNHIDYGQKMHSGLVRPEDASPQNGFDNRQGQCMGASG